MKHTTKTIIYYGLLLSSLYLLSDCKNKDKSAETKNKTEITAKNNFDNPSNIDNYVRFGRDDSTLIREDSLEARIFLSVSVRRRQNAYDSVDVKVDNIFSRSYVNGNIFTLDPINQNKEDYDANFRLFNNRYGNIMYNISEDLSNKFYSLPKDSNYAEKKESVKIDYRDYLK